MTETAVTEKQLRALLGAMGEVLMDRFDAIDGRLDGIDARLDRVERDLQAVKTHLGIDEERTNLVAAAKATEASLRRQGLAK